MLSLSGDVAIYAYTSPVDFRKQHDGLVAVVRDKLRANPMRGSLFVFFNRRRDRIKLLVWDRNGFWLLYKRLEKGTYEGLRRAPGSKLEISRVELSMLLDGIALGKGKKRQHFADVFRIDGRASEVPEEQDERASE